MRYRILIQCRNESDKHIAHITFESNDIDKSIKKVTTALSSEISEREKELAEYLSKKKKTFIKEMAIEIPEDVFDSMGTDISKEEFLENEIFFGKRE